MGNTVHELKTWPEHFINVLDGVKTFELRKNDRDFKVNDILILQEYDVYQTKYSGRMICKTITHILEGGYFGLEVGYVILSIK